MPEIKRIKVYEVPDGDSGTKNFDVTSDADQYHIKGAITTPVLSGDLTFTYTGSLKKGMLWPIQYNANIDLNGHNLVIFGEAIDERLAQNELHILAYYDGTKFVTVVMPNFASTAFIGIGQIDPNIVDDSTLELTTDIHVKDGGVTPAKLSSFGAAYLLLGNAGGNAALVQLSGDISVTDAGVVSIGATTIGTAELVDANVTFDKIQALTQGSIIVGDGSNRPAAFDAKTDAFLIIGNGTTIVSVALSGDATITAAGALTIANNAITTVKILDANVTLAKLENLTSGQIIVGNGSNRPTAVTPSGDVTISPTGVMTIGAAKVLGTMIADGEITREKLAKTDAGGGITEAVVATKTISGANLKALLDGTTNNCFTIANGEIVLGVLIFVQTGGGTTPLITMGPDSGARSAGADPDGFIKDVPGQTPGPYNNWVSAYIGALQLYGYFVADGAGYVTITSSENLSASSFDGGIIMFYIATS